MLHFGRSHRVRAALVGVLVLVTPSAVPGAPFCVRTEAIPPQCIYTDAASCDGRAQQMGGTCSVNTAEVHVPAGLGHYCLVTSSLVSACIYADPATCAQEALHQQGACVEAPNRPESPPPDPYRDIRPSMVGE
jgi:hypothetical protein